MPSTPLLDRVHEPYDLRGLDRATLVQLAAELRQETIDAVSVTGGHLGAGLGVVELTVALHYVFDTPHDRLIWDVGHQAYPHKILTGRRDRIRTLRQPDGLSGFTRRSESLYDPFGAAHSSTSISAGLGMATAAKLDGVERNVIAVIGDGAMSAGMAYEAMNNTGAMRARLIVILNDNDMSIAPPTGAMSAYLSKVVSSHAYRGFRHVAKQLSEYLPSRLQTVAERAEEFARGLATGGTLFEELGFYYIGPLDGHNLDHLIPVLENVRDASDRGPVLIHVVTQKGKGYGPAETASDKYHGVSKFDVDHRRAAQGQVERAQLHLGVRQGAGPRGGAGRPDRRHQRRHAGRHRPRPVCQGPSPSAASTSASPSSMPSPSPPASRRRVPPVLRDLFDLPATRLRPGDPRRRDPGPAGALRHRPRRPGRRRRRHPCWLVRCRLSRLPARLRHHGSGGRGRADADGGDCGPA